MTTDPRITEALDWYDDRRGKFLLSMRDIRPLVAVLREVARLCDDPDTEYVGGHMYSVVEAEDLRRALAPLAELGGTDDLQMQL